MTGKIINIEHLTKNYENNIILNNLSLDIKKSSISAIIGPNGSGKSTLFRSVLDICKINSGKIEISGKTGFMIEEFRPYDHLTVMQNLKAFYKLTDHKNDQRTNVLNNILTLTFINSIKRSRVKSLSTGQLRKVLFALALINDPHILILDEPFNSLDLKERIDMISTIKYLNKDKGKTIIISSHDLLSIYEICEHFYFIKSGRIHSAIDKDAIPLNDLERQYMNIYDISSA